MKDKFSYEIGTKLFFGENCIAENAAKCFGGLGKKAMLVTGRHSAIKSGAQKDVTDALTQNGIEYVVFNEVENNPSLETVKKGAEIARKEAVHFVIGIGGGSPIDAAKAISVLAASEQMDVEGMFANSFDEALPIIAVPTTAGTGSEITPYSVILRNDLQTKVSMGNALTYPRYALVDPKYTYELNEKNTVSTCVDAFTHVFEGYLGRRSTPLSDSFALVGIEIFGRIIKKLSDFQLSQDDRKEMMLLSSLGGIVIAQAGVTIPHGMGYCYTYFKGIPHGLANGLIMEEYLKICADAAKEKIDKAMAVMGYADVEEFLKDFKAIVGKPPVLSEDEIELYTKQTLLQKGSVANTPCDLDEKMIKEMWRNIH